MIYPNNSNKQDIVINQVYRVKTPINSLNGAIVKIYGMDRLDYKAIILYSGNPSLDGTKILLSRDITELEILKQINIMSGEKAYIMSINGTNHATVLVDQYQDILKKKKIIPIVAIYPYIRQGGIMHNDIDND